MTKGTVDMSRINHSTFIQGYTVSQNDCRKKRDRVFCCHSVLFWDSKTYFRDILAGFVHWSII